MSIVIAAQNNNWTYDTLISNIADWLHRTDLNSQIPNFIKMGESKIFRLLNISEIQKTVTQTATVGSRFMDLPDGCGEIKAIFLDTWQPRELLIARTEEDLPVENSLSASPTYYCVSGGKIQFDCLADQAHSITIIYIEKLSLSSINQDNEILINHPDLYLYASLVAAMTYIRDDVRLPTFTALFETALEEARQKEARQKSIVNLRTDFPLNGSTFNINRGY